MVINRNRNGVIFLKDFISIPVISFQGHLAISSHFAVHQIVPLSVFSMVDVPVFHGLMCVIVVKFYWKQIDFNLIFRFKTRNMPVIVSV